MTGSSSARWAAEVKGSMGRADSTGMSWIVAAGVVALAIAAGWHVARRRNRQRELMLLCRHAGLTFAPMDPFPDTVWLPFRWLGEERWIHTENVVWWDQEPDGVRAFDLTTERSPAAQDGEPTHHRYTCASVPLPFGCPRLEIRPRGALDHVAGAIAGDEVRLELEAFNRRFHVSASDHRFVVAFCSPQMMQAMLALPEGITIAVNEDRMLLRSPELSAAQVLLTFEAARALRDDVPEVVASLYPPRPMKGRHEDRWLQGHWSPEPIGEAEA
ncbi:MAG TPA: LPXTG cell wall anchor domain-containing protein [Actinomycetota bacterium]